MKRILLFFFAIVLATACKANSIISIWEGTRVNEPKVTLEIFLPEESAGLSKAIIVCPGGSYCWHDYETEGISVAKWLQSKGIAAFVLKYRTAGFFAFVTHGRMLHRGNRFPDMITDVQRAIQIVRENADEYSIESNRLGVMGFSAGGHLAMMSGCFFETDFLSRVGVECKVSLRPDFVVPIYPVVSMSDRQYTHRRSRRGALGEYKNNSRIMRDSLSLEKHIRENTPPVFLMNCVDDPIVKYQNSELLDSALCEKSIPHVYIQYKTGKHGFGADASKATDESIQWKDEFLKWLESLWKQ